MVADALELNTSVILVAALVPPHSLEACAGKGAQTLVLTILLWSHEAEVLSPVVERIAVDVVHELVGAGVENEAVHVDELKPAVTARDKPDRVAGLGQEPLVGFQPAVIILIDDSELILTERNGLGHEGLLNEELKRG